MGVWVQVPFPAPNQYNPNLFPIGDGFGFIVFFERFEDARMYAACVELRFLDGAMLAIDTVAVENEVAANMFERSELDYL